MQMRSFLGLTAHCGVVTGLNSVTLGVYELSERRTSEYLSEILLNTFREWGINPETISAVVTDNAGNIVKAIDLAFSQRKHIPCFAHTLNIGAQTILHNDKLKNIILKMESIITWFKQSCIASDELRKATTEETKLIQDISTRWNSTYFMIERFLKLCVYVNEIVSLLSPFEAATREVSGDH
ncbi:unnamed protein product [Psylliodes chrysocephalus]|uniref:Transposase n=1 Tax=Psylliodes chrysocephalus TaxID=3402493 RepID=A0A9P0GLB9_9CUCU|nr:unnamed protein product [Psylliodes chrysocephala]